MLSWIKHVAAELVNEERARNALPPIDAEVLEHQSTRIIEHERGVVYERDGWKVGYSTEIGVLATTPPSPFDYATPRCPFTGSLYDATGRPVVACAHDWQPVDAWIEQCVKCKDGRYRA